MVILSPVVFFGGGGLEAATWLDTGCNLALHLTRRDRTGLNKLSDRWSDGSATIKASF